MGREVRKCEQSGRGSYVAGSYEALALGLVWTLMCNASHKDFRSFSVVQICATSAPPRGLFSSNLAFPRPVPSESQWQVRARPASPTWRTLRARGDHPHTPSTQSYLPQVSANRNGSNVPHRESAATTCVHVCRASVRKWRHWKQEC